MFRCPLITARIPPCIGQARQPSIHHRLSPHVECDESVDIADKCCCCNQRRANRFCSQRIIASSRTGFYVVSEFAEDFDGDGVDNGTELLLGTDPFVIDNVTDASYPAAQVFIPARSFLTTIQILEPPLILGRFFMQTPLSPTRWSQLNRRPENCI